MTRSSSEQQEWGASSNASPAAALRRSAAAPLEADDLAASLFGTLGLLARFGLASHTRLLLGRDG